MQKFLLDSNILIYAMNKKQNVLRFLRANKKFGFFVTPVSRLEVLLGESKEEISLEEMERELDQFFTVRFDNKVVSVAALLYKQEVKKLKFKDLIIAATALANDMTLVTADRGFKGIKGLKLKLVSLS